MGVGRNGVFKGKNGVTGLGRKNGANACGAMLEVAFVRGVMRHLNDIDLPFAVGGIAQPEMPLQATLGGGGKVTKLQTARRERGGNGKAVRGVERGGVDVKVDIEVLQEQTRGKRADKEDLRTPILPTFAKTRVAQQGVRGLGCAFRTLNQGICRVG